MDEYYRAIQSLPSWLSRPLAELPVELAEQVHEIRLRVGCPVQMTISGVLCTSARIPALRQIVLTQLQMDEIFLTLCGGSVHTHQAEVAQGYVTLPNGCRAGLGGRFFLHPTQGAVLQQLHSVNLRIARRKWITLPEELRGPAGTKADGGSFDRRAGQWQNHPFAQHSAGTGRTGQNRLRH